MSLCWWCWLVRQELAASEPGESYCSLEDGHFPFRMAWQMLSRRFMITRSCKGGYRGQSVDQLVEAMEFWKQVNLPLATQKRSRELFLAAVGRWWALWTHGDHQEPHTWRWELETCLRNLQPQLLEETRTDSVWLEDFTVSGQTLREKHQPFI